jgi:farnesyl diphosphate synthase
MADFQSALAHAARITEAALEARLVADRDDAIGRLVAAMRHGVLGPGKRLRAFLVIESARLFGMAEEASLPAAAALECLHAYSLVHDDLPAMDDDAMRRGRPTVHKAFDEATAILAGDALLTLAFEILAEEATHPDAGVRVALIQALARASGANGMVGGQALDIAAEGAPSTDVVLHLQRLKTGALFRFACESGAILARIDGAHRAALGAYADALGLAFQIADDLLDAEGNAEEVGKRTGKDAQAGKATLVALLGPERARARLAALVAEGEAALSPFGARAQRLREAVRFAATRRR